jgi:cell division protein ZapA (FtsZ GTPase activity inhibitor)
MEERSIRIEIAGRAYPLTIGASEEENVRRAVEEINGSIARLKEAYPHTDKQDLLAMAALEVTTRALNNSAPRLEAEAMEVVTAIEELLADRRVQIQPSSQGG